MTFDYSKLDALSKLKGFVCWNALGKPTSFGLYEALLVRDEAGFGLGHLVIVNALKRT